LTFFSIVCGSVNGDIDRFFRKITAVAKQHSINVVFTIGDFFGKDEKKFDQITPFKKGEKKGKKHENDTTT